MNVLNDLTLRICLVYISSGNEFIEATLLFSKGVLSLSVCSVAAIYIKPATESIILLFYGAGNEKVLLPLAARYCLQLLPTQWQQAALLNSPVKSNSLPAVTSDTQNKEVYRVLTQLLLSKTWVTNLHLKLSRSLEKCDAGNYSLRFDGNTVAGNPDLLSVSNVGGTGTAATGVGIEITDNNGKPFAIGDGSNIKTT